MSLSGAAYCHPKRIQNWDCAFCNRVDKVTNISVFEDAASDAQGYVAFEPSLDAIVVAFRGTNPLSIRNWLDDLSFAKFDNYSGCQPCGVHGGFLRTYNSIRPGIMDSIRYIRSIRPDAKLHVTGHSLGAAMAILCALDLKMQLNDPPELVYTFGLPRVGNDAFVQHFSQNLYGQHFRVVHYADPVPHLPPQLLGFHDLALEVWYNEFNTNYKICDGSGEDPRCSDSILVPLLVTDHFTYFGLNFIQDWLTCQVF